MKRALIALILCAAALPGQVVRVAVTAFDEKTGQALTNLGPENFRVHDGDTPLKVLSAEKRSGPLDVLLLVDLSLLGEAVRPLIGPMIEQLAEDEQMAIVGFDQSATLLEDFTNSKTQLKQAVQGADYGNNPRVLDALYAALDGGLETATTRRAVVVLATGVEGRSRTGVSDVARLARERRAPIHFAYVRGVDSSLFEKVARAAAGSWFPIRKLGLDPQPLAEAIYDAVRSTYALELEGVYTLGDRVEAEIVDAPPDVKRPTATVLPLE